MIDIESEDYKLLEERCRNHEPEYDPERVIQFTNALRCLIVKYSGKQIKNVTCYKSRKTHLKKKRRRANFEC